VIVVSEIGIMDGCIRCDTVKAEEVVRSMSVVISHQKIDVPPDIKNLRILMTVNSRSR
jgi:hypothetical protein